MGKCKFLFRLTSFQLGCLESCLSLVSLFVDPKSKRFCVLVDNRPWVGVNVVKGQDKWFSFIQNPASKKQRISLDLIHENVSSFIVLEVSWDDVRGMNYLNQLQADTSLAVEARLMERWDFNGVSEAASCLSSCFSGTQNEKDLMKQDLENSICIGTEFQTGESQTPPLEVNDATNTESILSDGDIRAKKSLEDVTDMKLYKDVFISTKFDNRDLPFILRGKIISDPLLMNLLEAGLPSWVIFLQTYPGFSKIYRPWMCQLVKASYMMISFVTILIGLSELYKKIPMLKATAYRLIGPLLDWVETWDMISKIRCLGTMLVLQNFQKAFHCLLIIGRTTRSSVSMFTQPLARQLAENFGFLAPVWVLCVYIRECLYEIIYMGYMMTHDLLNGLVEVFLQNVWSFISLFWSIVTPHLYVPGIIKEILFAPFRIPLTVSEFVILVCASAYEYIAKVWLIIKSIFRINSATEANLNTEEASMLQMLWNDMLSQVFHALRKIFNGFVMCYKHRLSISNYLPDFRGRQIGRRQTSPSTAFEQNNLTIAAGEQAIVIKDQVPLDCTESMAHQELPEEVHTGIKAEQQL